MDAGPPSLEAVGAGTPLQLLDEVRKCALATAKVKNQYTSPENLEKPFIYEVVESREWQESLKRLVTAWVEV